MNVLVKMSDEEQTRDEIEEILNGEPVEFVQEPIVDEEVKPVVKAKPKEKKTKPTIKITKEPIEPIKEEGPEPSVEEKPEQ